mmetsp:Transcript_15717/g.34083  ORF Transcript_15717/g.34083 Transcript_15717/m.34083 type:complete len:239 (-) Transcript_15717:922-1638(-)
MNCKLTPARLSLPASRGARRTSRRLQRRTRVSSGPWAEVASRWWVSRARLSSTGSGEPFAVGTQTGAGVSACVSIRDGRCPAICAIFLPTTAASASLMTSTAPRPFLQLPCRPSWRTLDRRRAYLIGRPTRRKCTMWSTCSSLLKPKPLAATMGMCSCTCRRQMPALPFSSRIASSLRPRISAPHKIRCSRYLGFFLAQPQRRRLIHGRSAVKRNTWSVCAPTANSQLLNASSATRRV